MKAKLVVYLMAMVLYLSHPCIGKRAAKDWGKVCTGKRVQLAGTTAVLFRFLF